MIWQILIAVVLLVGLIGSIMSIKGWHWAQMLLLLGVFIMSIVAMVLSLEVLEIHKKARSKLAGMEKQSAELEAKNEALTLGADIATGRKYLPDPAPFALEAEGRMPGLDVWTHRLQELEQARGAVWRGVTPSGPVDPATSRLPVTIPDPKSHGLSKDLIVYAFEQGEPNAANPQQGAQYLGAFRVVEVRPDGAILESIYKLDNRTGNRIVASKMPWELYETMPVDKHELFAGLSEEDLRKLLPPEHIQEYVRDGQDATADDDEHHRAGYDEEGHRLGPDDAAKVAKWKYDRPLHDYAYLFSAAHREMIELFTQRTALQEDAKKLAAAHENAKLLGAMRMEEKQGLEGDLEHMKIDRQAIEADLVAVLAKLASAQAEVTARLAENARKAKEFSEEQLRRLEDLNKRAPAPAPESPFAGATR